MLNKDYREMLQCLLSENVDFILIGAYALAAHGYPRATGDIDIWVKPDKKNAESVYNALKNFGAPLDQIDKDDFCQKDLIYQIGIAPRRIDIVTGITGVEFDEAKNDHVLIEVEDLKIPVLSIDKLILNKLSTGREKDLLDARFLKEKFNK